MTHLKSGLWITVLFVGVFLLTSTANADDE